MTFQHRDLATGRWSRMPFPEQMANIGSEVERALNWRARNTDHCLRAFERALELMDLTLAGVRNPARLKELTRAREALADYFLGPNEFASTEASWRRYFSCFTYAARKNR